MSVDVATLSRAGGRPVNEDDADVLEVDGATCWVVADGLGGHRGGEVASRTAVEAVLASFRAQPAITADAVQAHIRHAHDAIVAKQLADPTLGQMRSTIVVLVASDRHAVWGHLGDSRLYRLQAGRVVERTRDHSVSQALVDAGEVDANDQGRHEDRSRLLRCLGKDDGVEPAVHAVESLCRDDDFLLCTDGFWEALSDTAIAADACGSRDAAGWLARLEARVTRGRPDDNYTASVIRVTSPDLPDPPPFTPAPTPTAAAQPAATAIPVTVTPRARRRSTGWSWPTIITAVVALFAIIGAVVVWRYPDRIARVTRAVRAARVVPTPPLGPSLTEPPPDPRGQPPPALAAPPLTSPGPPTLNAAPVATFDSPAAVPQNRVYRPAAKATHTSLDAAIAAAADGEEIWVGPGVFTGPIRPLTRPLLVKGAGRDRSHLDLSNQRGLELNADSGSLQDLDLCCATKSPVVIVGAKYAGTIAHNRIRRGRDFGVRITGRATPDVFDNEITDNPKGKFEIGPQANPRIR